MASDDPLVPEGFPDLFIYTLRDIMQVSLGTDPEFKAEAFITRPIRHTDPSRTVAVIEGPAQPDDYEMAASYEPSVIKWSVYVQVYVKVMDEIEGRNIRRRLLQRAKKTLFLTSTVNSLSQLQDGTERVSRFRWRQTDYHTVEAKNATNTFFLLGQMEIDFWTERMA